MINTRKIKGRMVELGISQQDAAKRLDIKQPTFNQKLNGTRDFKIGEVQELVNLLEIADDDVAEYFFVH